jgi:hypothetical protein
MAQSRVVHGRRTVWFLRILPTLAGLTSSSATLARRIRSFASRPVSMTRLLARQDMAASVALSRGHTATALATGVWNAPPTKHWISRGLAARAHRDLPASLVKKVCAVNAPLDPHRRVARRPTAIRATQDGTARLRAASCASHAPRALTANLQARHIARAVRRASSVQRLVKAGAACVPLVVFVQLREQPV